MYNSIRTKWFAIDSKLNINLKKYSDEEKRKNEKTTDEIIKKFNYSYTDNFLDDLDIEYDYNRKDFKEVYDSLLRIFEGQVKSINQQEDFIITIMSQLAGKYYLDKILNKLINYKFYVFLR